MRVNRNCGTPSVTIPCRYEPVEGEPCELDIRVEMDEGRIDIATFTCAHEALIMADPKMAEAMEAEALGALCDLLEGLYDAEVDARIDRALGK